MEPSKVSVTSCNGCNSQAIFSLDYSSEIEDLLFTNETFRRTTAALVQV